MFQGLHLIMTLVWNWPVSSWAIRHTSVNKNISGQYTEKLQVKAIPQTSLMPLWCYKFIRGKTKTHIQMHTHRYSHIHTSATPWKRSNKDVMRTKRRCVTERHRREWSNWHRSPCRGLLDIFNMLMPGAQTHSTQFIWSFVRKYTQPSPPLQQPRSQQALKHKTYS